LPDLQLSDGLVIHYVDAQFSGSPPVLLLHGLGVNSESWGMQVPALEGAGFRILMPDIRGFGKSTFPGGSVTVRRLASDIVLLLHNLHIPSTVVVGISMGGALALQMALDNPELVSRLILINTFSHLRPKRVKTWVYFAVRFAMLHIIGLKAQAHAVATHLFPSPADAALREIFYTQISQADPAGYRAAMRALARFNVSRRLKEIAIPTLVITGENDNTVPPDLQSALTANIPNARHVLIAGAGHAVIVEKPDRVNRLLISFIADGA